MPVLLKMGLAANHFSAVSESVSISEEVTCKLRMSKVMG